MSTVRRGFFNAASGIAVLVWTLGLEAQAPTPESAADAALDAALAGAHRSAANRVRDRHRHPKETLKFFGLRPGMTVVEIWPGPGWYTEVLAPAIGKDGKLYLAQYGDNPPFPYQKREMDGLAAKMRASAEVYGNVTLSTLAFPDELEIAPPGSADLVLTFRNVHNWFQDGYGPPNAADLAFAAAFRALKPGGVLGVVDHRWPDPATEDPKAANGYVSERRVVEHAERAGFRLAAASDVNGNPKDTHDHPQGVWTLPPDLALGDQDRDKYVAIGESDRLTLRFVKPETPPAGTAPRRGSN